MRMPIQIAFFVGNEKWAVRYWAAVPRVGDEVMLGAGKDRFEADPFGKAAFRVKRVVWGVEPLDASINDRQDVNVEVEPISAGVKA